MQRAQPIEVWGLDTGHLGHCLGKWHENGLSLSYPEVVLARDLNGGDAGALVNAALDFFKSTNLAFFTPDTLKFPTLPSTPEYLRVGHQGDERLVVHI